jgi:GntR family transcriptional regulator, transcriptional repressor for pyruvate dehydrogenase complex
MNSLGSGVIPRARLQSTLPDDANRQAYLRRVNQEHESIYSAIAAQDSETARASMRTHLSNGRERLRRAHAEHQ